ncbi:hypothetical protein TDB9533_00037 [Thalassocella blandensis]|nr:hypothetical protein TDB9533_00037 [Thalassocella blandensis]
MKPTSSYSKPKTNMGSRNLNAPSQNAAKSAKGKKLQKAPPQAQKNPDNNIRSNSQLGHKQHTQNPAVVVSDYDDNPGYKPLTSQMEFKGKMHRAASSLNPFKPTSDIKLPSNMDPSLNSPAGRVVGALTGQTSAEGIKASVNLLADSMKTGDSLSIDKTKAATVEGRASLSMLDSVAPGTSVASGVHLGPSAWVSLSYSHERGDGLNISKNDAGATEVKGNNQKSHQAMVGAFGGAKAGIEVGDKTVGPLVGVTGTVGVKQTTTSSSDLASGHSAGEAVADFAKNKGKIDLAGDQWQNNSVSKETTIPASLKAEATVTGTTQYYGDNDRFANTGALSVIAGVEVGDLKKAKDTSEFVVQASGQLYSDGLVTNTDNTGNSEVGRVDHQRPTEHAINIPRGNGNGDTMHGSRIAHPFQTHISNLDKELAPGMEDFAVKEFRNKFGDNIKRADMTFHKETLEDGRMLVTGELNPKVAAGKMGALPGLKLSNTVTAEFSGKHPLFVTAMPVKNENA